MRNLLRRTRTISLLVPEIRTRVPESRMLFQKCVPSSRTARSGAVRCIGAALSDLATLSVARANYALAFGLAGPGLTPCHIRAGTGLTPPTSAPGLPRRFAFRRAQVLVANKMDLESDRRVALERVWAFGLG